MKMPQSEEFGIDQDHIDKLKKSRRISYRFLQAVLSFTLILSCFFFFLQETGDYAESALWSFFSGLVLAGILLYAWELFGLPNLIPIFRRLASYEIALQKYQDDVLRKQSDFWKNLSGLAFELELAKLYRRIGYSVQETPPSGDGGIDLIISDDGKRTEKIIQCKRHKARVGVGAARDLYGALKSTKIYRHAVLASVSGFTSGTISFCHDKPIELLDLNGILKMHESAIESHAESERTKG